MLIIVDERLPVDVKNKLKSVVAGPGPVPRMIPAVIDVETDGIVYPAISGHPDIFFCQTPGKLVISPNLPEKYKEILTSAGIDFTTGNLASGIRHPASVHNNAAINEHYLIHRLEYTDPVILENCHSLRKIDVKQGYTRCNLLLLKDDHYITSDAGIHKTLHHHGLDGLLVSPEGVLLPGFQNGFIGGCTGLLGNTVFFTGSLSRFTEGEILRNYLLLLDYQIIELYYGPLIDGGGILFVDNDPENS